MFCQNGIYVSPNRAQRHSFLPDQHSNAIMVGYLFLHKCKGVIKCTVSLEEYSTGIGSYHTIDVEWKCQSCGNTKHPNLPTSEEGISIALTAWAREVIP